MGKAVTFDNTDTIRLEREVKPRRRLSKIGLMLTALLLGIILGQGIKSGYYHVMYQVNKLLNQYAVKLIESRIDKLEFRLNEKGEPVSGKELTQSELRQALYLTASEYLSCDTTLSELYKESDWYYKKDKAVRLAE